MTVSHKVLKAEPPAIVPSVRQYVRALSEAEPQISPKQRRMLQLHYTSPCLVTTARDLAFAFGYKDFGAANIQYGKLGSLVADKLRISYRGVSMLVLMAPPLTGTNAEWLWVLRYNVGRALEELGWVDGDLSRFFPWASPLDPGA